MTPPDWLQVAMTPTAWALLAMLPLAAGLVIWGALTGGPGPDQRHEVIRHARRGRRRSDPGVEPEHPDWIPPWERPGGASTQPLPPRDQLPWRDEELRPVPHPKGCLCPFCGNR